MTDERAEIDPEGLPVVIRPRDLSFPVVVLALTRTAADFTLHYATAAPAPDGPHEWSDPDGPPVSHRFGVFNGLFAHVEDDTGNAYEFRDGDFAYSDCEGVVPINGSWRFEPSLRQGCRSLFLDVWASDDVPDDPDEP